MFPESISKRIVALCGLLVALSAPAAVGQADLDGLLAELSVSRTLFTPGDPIRLRLTLFNGSDRPIEIPAEIPEADEATIGLPSSLVFGTPETPHLFLGFDADRLSPVRPQQLSEGPRQMIRLAPQTSLGTEIDLRSLDRKMRYSGGFQVEWRPFGEAIPPAVVEFRVEARKHAVLVTDYGKLTFSLAYDKAPRHVENLLQLARDRFYDGTTFHRIIPGALIQGGSPDGTSSGLRPDGRMLVAEFHDAPIQPGTLVMARRQDDVNSASCQFFIALSRLPELDGQYTVVGQSVDRESLRTLERIAELPTDQNGTPQRPPVIRFLTLVDAPVAGASRDINP